jgi:hypothetical protein
VVVWSNDLGEREHGVVWIDVGGVSGSLLDCFHFFFAAGVVEGTDYNWLSYCDVSGRGKVGLLMSVFGGRENKVMEDEREQ